MANDITSIAKAASDSISAQGNRRVGGRGDTVSATQQSIPVEAANQGMTAETESAFKSKEDLSKAVVELNDYIQSVNRGLEFSVDEDSGRSIIKVVDSETGDIIRQMPSEEILNIAQFLREGQRETEGMIFNERA